MCYECGVDWLLLFELLLVLMCMLLCFSWVGLVGDSVVVCEGWIFEVVSVNVCIMGSWFWVLSCCWGSVFVVML